MEQYPQFSFFECNTSNGCVMEGKKSEISFIFKPQEFGNFEGYYMFEILEKKINVPFLLVGKCRQPNVYFTESYISIKPTILKVHSTAVIMLKNDENMELSFKFHKDSFVSDDQNHKLDISPKKGTLSPYSEQTIE